jgi:hypothetical protein
MNLFLNIYFIYSFNKYIYLIISFSFILKILKKNKKFN